MTQVNMIRVSERETAGGVQFVWRRVGEKHGKKKSWGDS
jgi:hypothetical protein